MWLLNSAFLTGLAVTCTTSPFTNARTFIMTNPGQFKGMTDALKYIKKTYGVMGFFRGIWSSMGPFWTICTYSIHNLGTIKIYGWYKTNIKFKLTVEMVLEWLTNAKIHRTSTILYFILYQQKMQYKSLSIKYWTLLNWCWFNGFL